MDSYLESREALEMAEFQGGSRIFSFNSIQRVETSVHDYSMLLQQWNESWADMKIDLAEEAWLLIHQMFKVGKCTGLQDVQVVAVSLLIP